MIPVLLSTVVAAAVGVVIWWVGGALGADVDPGLTVGLSAGVTLAVNLALWAWRTRRHG